MKRLTCLLLLITLAVSMNCVLADDISEIPDASELADGFYRLIANVESGTAGSALKKAEAVSVICELCRKYHFDSINPEVLAERLSEACDMLGEEEKAAFQENAAEICEELIRLTDGSEDSGSVYADAGIKETIDALRSDPAVSYSVQCFVRCAIMSENDDMN